MTIPANLAAIHRAVYAWVRGQIAAGGALLSLAAAPYNVIWAAQSGPKPAHPYAVLSWVSAFGSVGGSEALTAAGTNSAPIDRREYDADGVLRVELLSRADLDPNSGMDETLPLILGLEASLRTSLQNERWVAEGLAFVDTRKPVAIPSVVGFNQERRAQIDVVFRARVRVDAVGQPVLVMGSINDIEGAVDLSGAVTGLVGTS